MKKFILTIFFLLVTISISTAQTIYVAESVTETNEPINAKNYWEIDPWGKSFFIVFDNEGETIEGNILYLFIDKYEDGKYIPFDSKSINIKPNSKRIKYDYNFSETGKYKLYFINVSQEKLASIVVTMSNKNKVKERTVKRSNYYDNVQLIFCKKILVGGTPMGITKRASLSENNGEIYVKITNFSPLKSEVILVDFWRKEHRSFEYDEYVGTKKYKIDPEWADTYFKYKFKQPGEYKIVIYNQAEVEMATGYINVLN
jgi:hypothetical protein